LDWSKIKNIFIISFLILDLYLIYEFVKVIDSNVVDVKSNIDSSIEPTLKAEGIEYGPLPEKYVENFILKANSKTFTIEDTQKSILSNQVVKIHDNIELVSILKEPLPITEKFGPTELNNFIKENVLYGDQYRFWKKSGDGSSIIYTQQYKDKPLFENGKARLEFDVNGENEIFSYTQSYLEDIQELSNPEKIIQPIKAIEVLYTNGELPSNSKITDPELGYYIYTDLSDTTQVLKPAWCFTVEGKGKLYVSAFEGENITKELNKTTEKVME
jgi:regulatory protein YycI of two-component signal transduction system YycFG